MALYLVRHAHAGSRKAWKGDDLNRPLDDRGRRQAKGLLTVMPDRVAMVLSSPAVRCVETVQGVADRAGVSVQLDDGLFEEAPAEPIAKRLRHRLREHPGQPVVACSHGDLIPDLLERWAAKGADLDIDQGCAKGSTWVLEADRQGRIVGGTYVPPAN